MEMNDNACVICKEEFQNSAESTKVTRGIPKLIEFAKKHGDKTLECYLTLKKNSESSEHVLVHEECRNRYTNLKRVQAAISETSALEDSPKKSKLRSSQPVFKWKTNCFFCDNVVKFDDKNAERYPSSRRVNGKEKSVLMRKSVLEQCDVRKDKLGSIVRTRLCNVLDLVAEEAVYHSTCHVQFFNNLREGETSKGRPENKFLLNIFEQVCSWLENENQLFTLEDVEAKMKELAEGEQAYGVKRIKQKLDQKYKGNIFFAEISGRKNVICFENMAHRIVSDKWYNERKANVDDEAKRIIETAAKLIKSDIKQFLLSNCDPGAYPSIEEAEKANWIPDYLRLFLSLLIQSKLKVESIGQCVMKAALPRSVMPPMLFALAVEMDHMFASRWLNDQLFRLGFSESYHEVNRFKQGVVMSENVEDIVGSYVAPGEGFVTYVADNVDHNVRTLDGHGTFHGMGVIAIVTNTGTFSPEPPVRLRPKTYTKADQLVKKKGIPIMSYDFPNQPGLDSVIFKPYKDFKASFLAPTVCVFDQLWHAAGLFSTAEEPRPNWNGFMQDVSKGGHAPKSKTVMLPIINLNPTNEACVYSTLQFVIEQSKRLGIVTPSITFDQQLWIIALEIIMAKQLNIVPLLGGFHMLMSFYGSIGNIMDGSGISKLFHTIYGENATKHILSGKATARANRAHILTESALLIKLQEIALQGNSPEGERYVDIEQIQEIYRNITKKNGEYHMNITPLQKLKEVVEEKKAFLCENSRTARLWIQYTEYVETCRNFIRSARTSDWTLHLQSASKMMNLFAATGHHNYAKSTRIYLQQMSDLPESHPWLYHKFSKEGLFVARRSDRYWAGLWPDLTIEQVMMRAIKSRGGLTRGSGFTESARILWIYSMHATSSYHTALSTLTNNTRDSSLQHEELGKTRLKRDFIDLEKIKGWLDLSSHNPFDSDRTSLQALDSGLTANEEVNCDQAELIGQLIQESLDGLPWNGASVKRSEKAVTLATLKPSIKVNNETVVVDPLVLFSRLIVLMHRFGDISRCFIYELAPMPTSLFKDNFMRKPSKSTLAKALDKIHKDAKVIDDDRSALSEDEDNEDLGDSCAESEEENNVPLPPTPSDSNRQRYVIDGGYLLRRIVWDRDVTFRDLVRKYLTHVGSRYGHCSIVFDGYQDGPSTKDHEHFRRNLKCTISVDISVHLDNSIGTVTQKSFLSNPNNKESFISLLAQALSSDGHDVVRCRGDADTAIVSSVLDIACTGSNVTLIAADTDLLIMLLYMWNDLMGCILMKNEATRKHAESVRDVGKICESLGDICKYITFIHAFGGCDTTSAIFGQGKLSILKLIKKNAASRAAADMFLKNDSTPDEIGEAGVKLFISLYGGKNNDTLSCLRYLRYMKMTSSKLQPEKLPPTERAAHFHSLRVYHQVQEWNTLEENGSEAVNWGWKLDGSVLVPIMTDEAPAPDELLNIVRCNCQMTSKNPCGGSRCSCRANGLKCVPACGDCRGTECQNFEKHDITCDPVHVDENPNDDDYGNLFESLFEM